MGEKIKAGPHITLERKTPFLWEVVKCGDMRVPGRIYGDRAIVDHLLSDVKQGKQWNALEQIVNFFVFRSNFAIWPVAQSVNHMLPSECEAVKRARRPIVQ